MVKIIIRSYRWTYHLAQRTVSMPKDCVQSLTFSYQAVEAALNSATTDPDFELKRRLAGICNELGCMFMNEADSMYFLLFLIVKLFWYISL